MEVCLADRILHGNIFLEKSYTKSGGKATIIFIIFSDFLMFCQILLSPQVKRCSIITCKHDIYELPHELLNNLRLRILGENSKISGKCLNFIE